MQKITQRRSLSLLAAALFACLPISAQQAHGGGVTDTEIRIGNIMPYTGPLAAFAAIGKAEAAYFDMVNERGGLNGRKIKFISTDDSSNPKIAVEQTRRFVEEQNVLLMFGSFVRPAIWRRRAYLNEKKVAPALCRFRRRRSGRIPKTFLGRWAGSRHSAPRAGSTPITSRPPYPDRKIAVLWQNDQFGRDLFRGLQEGLGVTARMIAADIAIEADMSIDTQVDVLKVRC